MICPTGKAEYFCKGGLDDPNHVDPVQQFAVCAQSGRTGQPNESAQHPPRYRRPPITGRCEELHTVADPLVLEIQPVPTAPAAAKQEDPVLRDSGLRADSYAVSGEGPPLVTSASLLTRARTDRTRECFIQAEADSREQSVRKSMEENMRASMIHTMNHAI